MSYLERKRAYHHLDTAYQMANIYTIEYGKKSKKVYAEK